MYEDYLNREDWTRRSLINIAKGGFFAADRAVRDYAENIWKIAPVKK
jgi:starch phosphorylase